MSVSLKTRIRAISSLFAAFGLLTAAAPSFADTVVAAQAGSKIVDVAEGAALDSIDDAAAVSGAMTPSTRCSWAGRSRMRSARA